MRDGVTLDIKAAARELGVRALEKIAERPKRGLPYACYSGLQRLRMELDSLPTSWELSPRAVLTATIFYATVIARQQPDQVDVVPMLSAMRSFAGRWEDFLCEYTNR